ncbi:MAG: hypothetical protein WBW16_11510 [Bacteroidota bacterium]
MKSRTTRRFRESFGELPRNIQEKARAAFKVWKTNPYHPSLRFKQVHSDEPIFSVRIGMGWRALGLRENDTVIWFWVGSHADYEKLVSRV